MNAPESTRAPRAAQIIVGSSDKMSALETDSVQLLFESPPYERMHSCCGGTACLSCYSGREFVERFVPFLRERFRVLSPQGSYVLNFQPQVLDGVLSPTSYLLPQAAEEVGFLHIDNHIWHKPNAAPFAPPRRLKNAHEVLWHFAKTREYHFDKDAVREPHEWAHRDTRRERYHHLGKDPGNVFTCAKSQDQTALGHPGKMKDGIATRFISLLAPVGALVADGFAGTGQTGVEAVALGRRFVGYELHDERAAQARRRLGVEEENVMMKPWMNAEETAQYLGLARATVYSKTSRGELPFHRQGRIVRYHREELDAWLRGGGVAGRPQTPANEG